jgi:hypothetical protein
MTLRRRLEALAEAAGVPWLPNGLRHSFATYHIALYEDAGKTALALGHTDPALTFRHYRALRTKEEAEAYFAIRPPVEDELAVVESTPPRPAATFPQAPSQSAPQEERLPVRPRVYDPSRVNVIVR